MMARITSVRVGRVATYDRPAWDHRAGGTWTSAYRKDEVPGRAVVSRRGLEGDEHADPSAHGAEHQALLAYAAAHYPLWQAELALPEFGPGALAENLTIDGLDESSVCIGDTFAVGEVVTQVTQPRGPCNNIAMYWNRPELLLQVQHNNRTGWYLRVLEPGTVGVGDVVSLRARPHPDFTIARVLDLHTRRATDPDAVRALAACEALAPDWRARFAKGA